MAATGEVLEGRSSPLPSGSHPLARRVRNSLGAHDVSIAAYVADHLLAPIVEGVLEAGKPRLVSVAREDDGIALLGGAYLGGQRGVMLMQSSGFGLCLNALASFILPYQLPVPMVVGLRGDLGEFNIAQVAGGQAIAPVCMALGIPYEAPSTLDELDAVLDGLLETSYATNRPVCIGIRRSLVQV